VQFFFHNQVEVHAVRGGQLILRVAPQFARQSLGGHGNAAKRGYNQQNQSIAAANKAGYNGNCFITAQSMDVLEKIFQLLTPRELAFLSLTSRAMRALVCEYLRHHCESRKLPERLKRFYEDHVALLLPKERVLKQRLEANPSNRLLLFSARKQFYEDVQRVSCAK